jgi:hypothetical protein
MTGGASRAFLSAWTRDASPADDAGLQVRRQGFGRSHTDVVAAERGKDSPLRHQHICVGGGLEAAAHIGVMARQQTSSESPTRCASAA